MFDQGRGFERGEGRDFAIPLTAFLTYIYILIYRHIHHILTFHTSGDTWPAAFCNNNKLKIRRKIKYRDHSSNILHF